MYPEFRLIPNTMNVNDFARRRNPEHRCRWTIFNFTFYIDVEFRVTHYSFEFCIDVDGQFSKIRENQLRSLQITLILSQL